MTVAKYTDYKTGVCDGGCSASGNALVSINVVALRRARLVLGWVTLAGSKRHRGDELPRNGPHCLCEIFYV